MTLKSRMLMTNFVMFATLFVATTVSLWVLWVMAGSLNWVTDEYSELRYIDKASNDLAAADALLISDHPDCELVEQRLDSAIESLRSYLDAQSDDDHVEVEGEPVHGDARHQLAHAATRALESIVRMSDMFHDLNESAAPVGDEALDLDEMRVAVARVHEDLAMLADDADTAVMDAHGRGRAALEHSVTTLIAVNIAAVMIVVFSGIMHYMSVIPPLAKLRDRVREIASGKLDQRLFFRGKDEFADLADDFNRMIDELEALYRDLEQRVQSKSLQLVRSERLASVGYLAAGLAHEINNPLSIIAGHAELALKDLRRLEEGRQDKDVLQGLEIIHDEAFRCKGIIEKLLTLVRNPDGPRVAVSLNELVYEVAGLISGLKQFNKRNPALNIQPDDKMRVMAHASELKQVLLNLAVNAMEATAETNGWVEINGKTINGEVELSVIDSGRGMSADALAHVFEPFYTDKRGAEERGNGLGLSIVHAIIRDHGGRIEAFSDGPGRGSRFTIHLPVAGASDRGDQAD